MREKDTDSERQKGRSKIGRGTRQMEAPEIDINEGDRKSYT